MDEKNNTTERPAFKAPESAPVRRVGTLTLGVCLIACGVLFLCYFFVPHFNWDLALKIAPAAGLILLGCEVLYLPQGLSAGSTISSRCSSASC